MGALLSLTATRHALIVLGRFIKLMSDALPFQPLQNSPADWLEAISPSVPRHFIQLKYSTMPMRLCLQNPTQSWHTYSTAPYMGGSTNRGNSTIDPPNYTIMMKNETHPQKTYWTFLHGSCFNSKYLANVKVLFSLSEPILANYWD